jgi:hypothetical protein
MRTLRAGLASPTFDDANIALTRGLAQGESCLVIGRVVAVCRSLQGWEFDHHGAGADGAFDHGLCPGANEEFCAKAGKGGGVGSAVEIIGRGVGDGDMGDPIGFCHGILWLVQKGMFAPGAGIVERQG